MHFNLLHQLPLIKPLFQTIQALEKERDELAARLQHIENQSLQTHLDNLPLSYPEFVKNLLSHKPEDEAFSEAVGGQYEFMGSHLLNILRAYGLKSGDYVIDVGCGSGRVAYALSKSDLKDIRYLGLDVSEDLLNYSRKKCAIPTWQFKKVEQVSIPERDNQADLVYFFSVFTHISPEESYLYLNEARRILKKEGKIVFSFFDFKEKEHWTVFKNNVSAFQQGIRKIPDVFLSQDAIKAWCEKLDLEIEYIGSPDGGQSRCVLRQ